MREAGLAGASNWVRWRGSSRHCPRTTSPCRTSRPPHRARWRPGPHRSARALSRQASGSGVSLLSFLSLERLLAGVLHIQKPVEFDVIVIVPDLLHTPDIYRLYDVAGGRIDRDRPPGAGHP